MLFLVKKSISYMPVFSLHETNSNVFIKSRIFILSMFLNILLRKEYKNSVVDNIFY